MAIYGVEGSKPGAAVTAVYLSNAVLPLERSGHGELLDRTMMNTKIFCATLYQMGTQTYPYTYEDENGNEQTMVKKFECYQLPRKYS